MLLKHILAGISKPDKASLHQHGALTPLALCKVVISFYQSEKWTWQQMLVFLLEIKCLNNSQKCLFSPLDNKLSALPSTLWHWSRCPSLSNGVQALLWPWVKLAKKALGFSSLPWLLVTLKKKELVLQIGSPLVVFCLNKQNRSLLEAGLRLCF